MAERRWRVRLGAAAELDFANIVKWTAENFGARQARITRTHSLRLLVDLPMARMWRGAERETRSCQAFARSMLRGTADRAALPDVSRCRGKDD
jgi:toxin ParE1/3/4